MSAKISAENQVSKHVSSYMGNVHVYDHKTFQVPKMEGFLNHIFGYLGVGGNPYISRIHTAYIGEDSSILGT